MNRAGLAEGVNCQVEEDSPDESAVALCEDPWLGGRRGVHGPLPSPVSQFSASPRSNSNSCLDSLCDCPVEVGTALVLNSKSANRFTVEDAAKGGT